MNNGADDPIRSFESIPVTEQGKDTGREISVGPESSSGSNTLLPDKKDNSLRSTHEWDSYIDSQIRDSWSDLSHEEQAFCDEYLDNGYKHREAAVLIERPESSGIRLLHKPLCREYIVYQEQKRKVRRIVSEQFFDAQLANLYDQATGLVEVPLVTGSGIELTARKFNGNLALSIIQERAKISGVTKPEILDSQVNVIINVGDLYDNTPKEIN